MGEEKTFSREFKMQEFIDYADQQSDGAAPFKEMNNNDVTYLHMRTKALDTWNKMIE